MHTNHNSVCLINIDLRDVMRLRDVYLLEIYFGIGYYCKRLSIS